MRLRPISASSGIRSIGGSPRSRCLRSGSSKPWIRDTRLSALRPPWSPDVWFYHPVDMESPTRQSTCDFVRRYHLISWQCSWRFFANTTMDGNILISLSYKFLSAERDRWSNTLGVCLAFLPRILQLHIRGSKHLSPMSGWTSGALLTASRNHLLTTRPFCARSAAICRTSTTAWGINIAPLQKAGLLAANVLSKKDIEKAIADRAQWRANERRWYREGKLPQPGWWQETGLD